MLTSLFNRYDEELNAVLTSKVARLSDFHFNLHKVGLLLSSLLSVFVVSVAVYIALTEKDISHFVYTALLSLMMVVVFLHRPFFFKPPVQIESHQLKQHQFFVWLFIISSIVVGMSALLFNNILINILFTALLLEATRRVEGKLLPIIILVSLTIFIFFSDSSFNSFVLIFGEQGIFSTEGIYGEAFTTVLKIVYIFTLFSFVLHLIKIDELLDIWAFKITHERRSGPGAALYAILASSFYGAISGASSDNVEQTGEKTIPVMTQAGYPAKFAASVEAASSVVGQLMPPIMGVVAFIIVETSDNEFSYLDVMFAALVPVGFLVFSLIVAAIFEAQKDNLTPLDLEASQKETFERVEKEKNIIKPKSIILIFSFFVFFILLSFGVNLALCGLATLITTLTLSKLIPQVDFNSKDIFEALYLSGKSAIIISISCAVIGILIFLFEQAALGDLIEKCSKSLLEHEQWYMPAELLFKLVMFVIAAGLILILGIGLPTPAVYLISIFMVESLLEPFNIEPLHIYMFVFYYAVLAGITPPYALLVKDATDLVNKLIKKGTVISTEKEITQRDLEMSTLRLSFVAFLLPIAWIYHPEIMINNWSFANFSQVIYVLFSFVIAIVAIAVAQYGIFRRKKDKLLSGTQRTLLSIAAFLIILPNYDLNNEISMLLVSLTVLGVFIISCILIYDDWYAEENSLLRPSITMLRLITESKNISSTTYIIFFSLVVVYTGFFSTSSLAHYLQDTFLQKWLVDRPHLTLRIEDCNNDKITEVEDWFKKHHYNVSMTCSPFAELELVKLTPGEVRIEPITAYEYQDIYFSELLTLDDKTKLETFFTDKAQCLTNIQEPLTKQQFNPKGITSFECSQAALLPNPPKSLPLIYISSSLAKKLGIYSGSIVSIHNAMYPNNLQKDLAGQSEQQHYFVVALIFKLSEEFSDLANLVIFPQQSLEHLFTYYSTDLEANYKLIVKLNDLENLNDLQNAVREFQANKEIFEFEIEKSESIIDELDGKRGFLSGIQAIAWLSGFICLLILAGGISQIIESNRKTIALMRVSGLQSGVGATFILLLAFLGTVIPAVIGVILSAIVNQTLAGIFKDIVPELNLMLIIDIGGVTLLMAIITAIFLTWLHFSHTIPKELSLCQQ